MVDKIVAYLLMSIIILCIVAVIISFLNTKKVIPFWNEFAKRLGLVPHMKTRFACLSNESKVEGIYRNHSVVLETDLYYIPDNEIYRIFTGSMLSVKTLNPNDVSMSVYPRYFKFFKFFNTTSKEDIKVGAPLFDELFEIRGNKEQEILRILDSEIRTKIIALSDPKKFNMKIDGEIAFFIWKGLIKDIDMLISVTDILIDIVEMLECR
ncbi:MAG: hypothetical protein U9N07_05800 [Euryarchaeota archaeon]|nr:hypothetical protein [Euryarchaeota archaeon]